MKDIIEFKKYVDGFNLNDKTFIQKYDHSIRVMNLCEKFAKLLFFSEEDQILAKKIGLLHDIGRFNELKSHGNLYDKEYDHAKEGIKVLFDEQEIKNYDIDISDYELVEKAIFNHNKYEIINMKSFNERELRLSKLIRDCDKIDILYLHNVGEVKIIEDNKEISLIIKDNFFKHKPSKHDEKRSKSDSIVLLMSFVFDINYECILRYIKEEQIYEKLYLTIENKNLFDEYFEEIYRYIDKRLEEFKC